MFYGWTAGPCGQDIHPGFWFRLSVVQNPQRERKLSMVSDNAPIEKFVEIAIDSKSPGNKLKKIGFSYRVNASP